MLAAASGNRSVIEELTGVLHVLRHRDIEELMRDARLSGVGLTVFDAMGVTEGPLRDWYGALMFTSEGASHDRLRRLVSKAFTPRSVERLRTVAADLVRERLEPLAHDGGGDLVVALADVPMRVMCALLGVPGEAVPEFVHWADALSPIFGFMEPAQIAAANEAIGALLAYVERLVAKRTATPADDLITALVQAELDGDRLTRDETVSMVANLLVAGHDTTASQIGCTLLTLLERPADLALARDEASVVGLLVAETMRFEPSVAGAPRTLMEPMTICGIERPAGTMVLCNFLTANRDPAVWKDPDEFVARRFAADDTPRQLAFGGGPHFCLGAALARMTLEETVRGVAGARGSALPRLTEEPDEIPWRQVLGRSPARLAVTI